MVNPRDLAIPKRTAPAGSNADSRIFTPGHGDIPGLNGMRAIAVLLVVLFHTGYDFVPGIFGVTVFFVLSGYLITTLLQREHASTGTISFGRFYARRALRLLPPLYIVTLLICVAVQCGLIAGRVEPGWISSTLFFFGNYFWLVISPDSGMPQEIQLVWSLAVEEHFYLLWPPLALLFFRARDPRRAITLFVGTAIALVIAWRMAVFAFMDVPGTYIAFATETRIDSLLVGCWLALARNPLTAAPVDRLQRTDYAWLAASAAVFVIPPLLPDSDSKLIWVLSTHPILLAPVFWLIVARHELWPFRLLRNPVLDYVGRISYTLYLVHWMVASIVAKGLPDVPVGARLVVTLAVAIAISELVRRFVEAPLVVLRQRLKSAGG